MDASFPLSQTSWFYGGESGPIVVVLQKGLVCVALVLGLLMLGEQLVMDRPMLGPEPSKQTLAEKKMRQEDESMSLLSPIIHDAHPCASFIMDVFSSSQFILDVQLLPRTQGVNCRRCGRFMIALNGSMVVEPSLFIRLVGPVVRTLHPVVRVIFPPSPALSFLNSVYYGVDFWLPLPGSYALVVEVLHADFALSGPLFIPPLVPGALGKRVLHFNVADIPASEDCPSPPPPFSSSAIMQEPHEEDGIAGVWVLASSPPPSPSSPSTVSSSSFVHFDDKSLNVLLAVSRLSSDPRHPIAYRQESLDLAARLRFKYWNRQQVPDSHQAQLSVAGSVSEGTFDNERDAIDLRCVTEALHAYEVAGDSLCFFGDSQSRHAFNGVVSVVSRDGYASFTNASLISQRTKYKYLLNHPAIRYTPLHFSWDINVLAERTKAKAHFGHCTKIIVNFGQWSLSGQVARIGDATLYSEQVKWAMQTMKDLPPLLTSIPAHNSNGRGGGEGGGGGSRFAWLPTNPAGPARVPRDYRGVAQIRAYNEAARAAAEAHGFEFLGNNKKNNNRQRGEGGGGRGGDGLLDVFPELAYDGTHFVMDQPLAEASLAFAFPQCSRYR